ncbi:hypothetical protein V8F20_006578 [Naviculisporaceae sp. PSN 640]
MGINQSNPTCEANACLNRVIGIPSNFGFDQWRACITTFSSAQRETVTLGPFSTFTSTVTATASATDVVVEVRTTEATVYSTSTPYLEVWETTTAFTTTSVLTASTTVTTTVIPAATLKKHKKRGGRCKPTSTTLSSAIPSSVASSSVGPSPVSPSSVALSAPASSSSASSSSASSSSAPSSSASSSPASSSPASSSPAPSSPASSSLAPSSSSVAPSSTTSPPSPVSIAPECPSLEAYSSACSCIYAASDATSTITYQLPDPTVIVTETITSSAVPSTSTEYSTVSTVTVTVLQSTVTKTLTSTINTGTSTTTTTTSTATCSLLPTETAQIIVVGGPHDGRVLGFSSTSAPLKAELPGTSAAAQVVVSRAGGQPYLASNPSIKMWITYQQGVGRLYFASVTNPGSVWYPVSCSVNNSNVLSCRAGSLDVDTLWTVPTNFQLYLTNSAYLSTTTTPYSIVNFKLSTCQ